jgi:hypothetical protein
MDCDSIGNVRLTSVVASKNGHTCGKDIRSPLLGFLLSPGTSGRPSDWSVTVNCGMSGAFTVTSNRIPSEGSPIKMNPQNLLRVSASPTCTFLPSSAARTTAAFRTMTHITRAWRGEEICNRSARSPSTVESSTVLIRGTESESAGAGAFKTASPSAVAKILTLSAFG